LIHERTRQPGARPANRGSRRLGLAGVYTVAVLLVMGLSDTLVGIGPGTFSLNAAVTVLSALLCWTAVLQIRSLPRLALRSVAALFFFVFWLTCEMLLSRIVSGAPQFLLVQVSFAGTILVAASAQYRFRPELNHLAGRAIRIATLVLLLQFALSTVGGESVAGPRATAMVALVCASWFLAERLCGRVASTRWAIVLVVAIGLSLSRTALVAAVVLLLVTAGLLSSRHRARSLGAIILVGLSAYWLVNYWAPLHDRFVTGDVSLSVAGIGVNAAGRTQVWQAVWDDWKSEPFIGHGPGSASALANRVVPGFGQPHNDYLRLFDDLGLVGLGLLVWFVIRTARLLLRARARPRGELPAKAALLAGLSVLIMMVTDNPLDYSFVMLPLAVLIGLALGARSPGEGMRSDRESVVSGSARRGSTSKPDARRATSTRMPKLR
jgi:O-antigen ligase